MKAVVERTYAIVAVDRAAAVLAALVRQPRSTLVEIARATELSKSTALRYLSSLADHGFVEREDGCYRLGLELFRLGQEALAGRDPRDAACPLMRSLLERFGETVNLAARYDDELVVIEVLESLRSIKKGARVGGADVWHASSVGKAILAFLPPDEARTILERRGMPRLTTRTLTSFDELERDLARVRHRGYAFDDAEGEEDLRCVGAPVFDHRGTPTYAISLSGPANRFDRETVGAMGPEVRGAAAAISARLGFVKAARTP